MPLLPPIGAEIPCSNLAVNTPLKLRDRLVSVDFRGGFKHRVDVNPDDPINSVRLRLVGLRASAELPDGGGTVTIEQNDVDVDARSLLRVTQSFPPKYEHIMDYFRLCTMVIDQAGDGEPLVLLAKGRPMVIGQLTQYPPKGDLYQLQGTAEFVLPDDPDNTIATIQKYPVKVGGL